MLDRHWFAPVLGHTVFLHFRALFPHLRYMYFAVCNVCSHQIMGDVVVDLPVGIVVSSRHCTRLHSTRPAQDLRVTRKWFVCVLTNGNSIYSISLSEQFDT
jgi:hypothetical protein